jgi:hypothetical protein
LEVPSHLATWLYINFFIIIQIAEGRNLKYVYGELLLALTLVKTLSETSMSKQRGCLSPRKLGRRIAFQGIFNAFRWLTDHGSTGHTATWLGGYPLLNASTPRNALLAFEFLCRPSKPTEGTTIVVGPTDFAALVHTNASSEGSPEKEQFVALTYLDAPCSCRTNGSGSLSWQEEQVRELFKETYGSKRVIVVRSDDLHSNGDNSVRESITNLICAEFFMSKGYVVLADCGSGPDLIAFRNKLVDELRDRKFIGQGATVSQLAIIRAFGKVVGCHKEDNAGDEVIAVETESVNPQKGVKQLRNGYDSQRFSYMGFFDRRVLAAPFLSRRQKGLDVFTYGTGGVEYWGADEACVASDFWKSKKRQFMKELEESLKTMLIMNLTYQEIVSMVSCKPPTAYAALREAASCGIDRILDKIESVV